MGHQQNSIADPPSSKTANGGRLWFDDINESHKAVKCRFRKVSILEREDPAGAG